MFKESTFYSPKKIDETETIYRLIIGQRSNGKTYSMCEKILTEYKKTGRPSAYIRRFAEDIKPKNIESLFNPHDIKKITRKFNAVQYRSNSFYFVYKDENGNIKSKDKNFFCKCYALNTWEHSKGADSGYFKYVIFDEFISRCGYLSNEFTHFQNLLSSIIRDREDVVIYMLANTVSKFCPYFAEMKIDIESIKQGDIICIRTEDKKPFISVEYCSTNNDVKNKIIKYFDFDTASSTMITTGEWEIPSYPHLYFEYDKNHVIFSFYIDLNNIKLNGDIMEYDENLLLFIYPMTKEKEKSSSDLWYTDSPKCRLHQEGLLKGNLKIHKLIKNLISENRIFFSDNFTGDKFFNLIGVYEK